jgi:RNA polymerase sigma-70 factor (ECF subfamily)
VIAVTKKIPASSRTPAVVALAAEPAEEVAAPDPRIGQLIAREYAAVWRFLRRLGVPAADVDDAAQRVFARVLAQGERIEPGSERAYLMRAAFRAALEHQRDKKRWLSRASEVDIDETTSGWPTPDQSLAQRQELELLDRALAQLPPEMRAVLTLFELEGLTFSEIAVALQLPRGTVASRVRRARERFTQAVRRLQPGSTR